MKIVDSFLYILPIICLLILVDNKKKKKSSERSNNPKNNLICNCPYPRKGQDVGYITWNFDDNSFTDFILVKCDDCSGFYGFPQSNFDLTLSKDKEKFTSYLVKIKKNLQKV